MKITTTTPAIERTVTIELSETEAKKLFNILTRNAYDNHPGHGFGPLTELLEMELQLDASRSDTTVNL